MKSIDGIEVITFDGDGTLWDFKKVMRYALKKLVERLRNLGINAKIEDFIEVRKTVAEQSPDLSLYKIRRISMHETLKFYKSYDPRLAEELFKLYLEYRHERIELYDDVIPVLEQLKNHYKIGLITNGNTRFENHPISKYFDFAIQASLLGISKPDSRVFKRAIELAGTEKILHVGDSIEEDYLGAKSVGLSAIWLNREGIKPDVKIDHEIHSLQELQDQIVNFLL